MNISDAEFGLHFSPVTLTVSSSIFILFFGFFCNLFIELCCEINLQIILSKTKWARHDSEEFLFEINTSEAIKKFEIS